jgi:septum formation protein
MALWRGAPLVLASKSESRHAMLRNAGIPHEVSPAGIDERAIEEDAALQSAAAAAELLACAKALAVSGRRPAGLILGADQTLAVEERRLSKPGDRAIAREQLKYLRGRTHELHSAVAIARDGKIVFRHCEAARMRMRDFSDAFLESYLDLAGDAVTASVGGYQLEGAGIHLFERIAGDHFVILGLPLLPLLQFLRKQKLLLA